MKKTNVDVLLEFLKSEAVEVTTNPIDGIIEFLNTPEVLDITNIIIEKIQAKIDFHKYFTSNDGIEELKLLKTEDIAKYYKIIHYENIFINIITKCMEMPYTVVLNPDNLDDSYYLVIKVER